MKKVDFEDQKGTAISSYRETVIAINLLVSVLERLQSENKLPEDSEFDFRVGAVILCIELGKKHFPGIEREDVWKKSFPWS